MLVSSLDPELSPECFTGVASLSPSLTDTVIGLLDFGVDVSGVLLPLALLLLLVTLIVSFAGPTVIGFFVIGAGVSGGLLLPLALMLLLVTQIVSFAAPSEVSVFVVGFLLLGAGVFSWEEDVFSLKKIAVWLLPCPCYHCHSWFWTLCS